MTASPSTSAVPDDPQVHGEAAAQRLRDALALHGLVLPSVWGGAPVCGRGFVELGGCSADTADALAKVLEAASSRQSPPTRRKQRVDTPR
ncbi:hypothetical protein [Streptomyces torulosus]|uniref:hypothetical protein n=1 Tax=Streptomyces torulosus TaxID=68276 RepID=UPI0006EB95CE|nr:hypothetical protein [Streptomyces torulosus]